MPAERRRRGELLLLQAQRPPLGEGVGEAGAVVGDAGEGVEDGELVGGFQEVLVVVLAVDVDEQVGGAAHHRGGGGLAVDRERGPAGGEELTRDEHLVAGRDGLVEGVGERRGEGGVVGLEHAGDAGLVGTRPEHVVGFAQADQRLEGTDDQRLARAGLAGEDVEARLELDGGVFDDRQVGDVQFAEHPCGSVGESSGLEHRIRKRKTCRG